MHEAYLGRTLKQTKTLSLQTQTVDNFPRYSIGTDREYRDKEMSYCTKYAYAPGYHYDSP